MKCPSKDKGILNSELIADAADDEIDQVANLARPVIPAGHGREARSRLHG